MLFSEKPPLPLKMLKTNTHKNNEIYSQARLEKRNKVGAWQIWNVVSMERMEVVHAAFQCLP